MSAIFTKQEEQRAAAANLARLAHAERKAWAAYAFAPAGAEEDFSAESLHMRWHRALAEHGRAIVRYRRQYGREAE